MAINFPPHRFPTNDKRIEPYILPENKRLKPSKIKERVRGDCFLYNAKLTAMKHTWFITDSGTLIKVIDASASDGWYASYFNWDGAKRRILQTHNNLEREKLLDLLKESWTFQGKEGDSLYDEAEMKLASALNYDPKNDKELIAKNFDLLLSNTDRIINNTKMANGALGSLRVVFIYLGMKRFPVSALLKAWKDGKWKTECKKGHESFVVSAGGGLSGMGDTHYFCPTCGRLAFHKHFSASMFGSIDPYLPKHDEGLRLDEIIDELGGNTKVGK